MNEVYLKIFVDFFNEQDAHLSYFDNNEYFNSFLEICRANNIDLSSYSTDEIKGALAYAYNISNKGKAGNNPGGARSLHEMAREGQSPIAFGMAGICSSRCTLAGACGRTPQSMNPAIPMSYSAGMSN